MNDNHINIDAKQTNAQSHQDPVEGISEHEKHVHMNAQVRKILDDRYLIIKTIGEGRYAKVKLAIDLQNNKSVAIKIMRVKQMVNKKQCLEFLFTEINILTECRHPNVVKILDASFDGTILKEQSVVTGQPDTYQDEEEYCSSEHVDQQIDKVAKSMGKPSQQIEMENKMKEDDVCGSQDNQDDYDLDDPNHILNKGEQKKEKQLPETMNQDKLENEKLGQVYSQNQKKEDDQEYLVVKRKTEVCYYVMKLAEYGELYSFIEHTERFDESMSRYILDQVLEGIKYLHQNGIVHRDIKPENLLINKKGRIIIADFSFAIRMREMENDGIFMKKYDPIVDKKFDVGSETYNAPEIWDNEINLQEFEMKMKAENDDPIFDYSAIDSQLRNLSVYPKYNGEKADVFSIGACLFMISMKTPPFRKSVQNDPYFKRLTSTQKQNFWKIFKGFTYSQPFRDLIEKTLTKFPGQRFSIDQIRGSSFFDTDQVHSKEQFLEEIVQRYKVVEKSKQMDMGQFNHESNSVYYSEEGQEDEFLMKDNQEFEEARQSYISRVEDISKMIRHQRNMKKIKKECFKNMIAGPSLIDHVQPSALQFYKLSNNYSINKKDSLISGHKSGHKNSLVVGPSYNSDSEDFKQSEGGQQKAVQSVNREAKNWQQQLDRQSSHDLL